MADKKMTDLMLKVIGQVKLDYLKNCDLYHELWLNNLDKNKR